MTDEQRYRRLTDVIEDMRRLVPVSEHAALEPLINTLIDVVVSHDAVLQAEAYARGLHDGAVEARASVDPPTFTVQ